MFISRMSQGDGRRPRCSPRTRRGGSRRTLRSCRSCCGSRDSGERALLFRVFTMADRKLASDAGRASGPASPFRTATGATPAKGSILSDKKRSNRKKAVTVLVGVALLLPAGACCAAVGPARSAQTKVEAHHPGLQFARQRSRSSSRGGAVYQGGRGYEGYYGGGGGGYGGGPSGAGGPDGM